jgi:hypothetical protein
MAETSEAPKVPATTSISDWLIPNQDKFEQVIDARLAKHAENEKAEKHSSRSRSTPTGKDEPKS